MAKELAVILNDGSPAAAVAAAVAAQKYRVAMVHVTGDEAAAGRRRQAFDRQAEHFGAVKVWVVAAGGLQQDGKPEQGLQREMVGQLPGVALAVRAAAAWKASAVYLPMCVGPGADELARGTEFVQIWNELVQMPCGQERVEVVAPVLELEPWQVIDLGFQVAAPFEKTWSCDAGSGDEPCGKCKGCALRLAAFQRAAKADPLKTAKTGG